MLGDYFITAMRNLTRMRLRSILTMVGIFIGIAAVVALVSLGQGLEKYIDDEFAKLGKDKLIIQPKGQAGFGTGGIVTLNDKDIREIESVRGILDVGGMTIRTIKIKSRDETKYFAAFSMPEERNVVWEMFDSYEIEYGRQLEKGEKNKVVLGNYFHDNYVFDKNLNVGDKIKINDKTFDIVGFYETIGNPQDDQNVYLMESGMRELFKLNDTYDMIYVKFDEALDPLVVSENVERKLRRHRNLDEGNEDFIVQSFEELMETFGTILNIVQVVLIGIASISLLVGGIGIMNTMYTSVLERTKEIGVMKAIGARNSSILFLFVIESGILGLGGGLVGVLIGAGFSKLVEIIATSALKTKLIQAYFPWYLIVGALSFSFIIGTLSGFLPAYNASKQDPVDSLRYE